MYYDRQGNQISVEEWLRLFDDGVYKRIAKDQVDEYEVSTVWLGLDHSFMGGPPLIFETTLFGDGDRNNDMWRYSTEQEAIEGHASVVAGLANWNLLLKE